MYKANIRRRAAGFTLVEIVIAIAVVALVTTLVVVKGNSDDTRTTVLMSKMQEVSSGLLRMKADSSCFPKHLDGLLTPQSESDCGTLTAADWKGNYISESTRVNPTSHTLDLAAIIPGTELTFEKSVVGTNVRWMLFTKGLPEQYASGIAKSCGSGEKVRCGFDVNRHEAFVVVDEAVANTPQAAIATSLAYSGPSGTPASPVSPPLVLGAGIAATPLVGPAPALASPFVPAVLVAPTPTPVMPASTPAPAVAVLAPPRSVLAAPRLPVVCPDGSTLPFGSTCPVAIPPIVSIPAAPAPGPQCVIGSRDCPTQSVWYFDLPGAKLHLQGTGFYNKDTNTFTGLVECADNPGHAAFLCGYRYANCGSDVACTANYTSGQLDGWGYNNMVEVVDMPALQNVAFAYDFPILFEWYDMYNQELRTWGSAPTAAVYYATHPIPPIGPIDPTTIGIPGFGINVLESYISRCDLPWNHCIVP